MAINLERFVKAKRFTEDHVLDDASDQILVKVATDSVAGKVALNAGTSLPGDATNCTDALTACGLNALLTDATVGGNTVINNVKALIPQATETVVGRTRFATNEETRAPTAPSKTTTAVTPDDLSYTLQTGKQYNIFVERNNNRRAAGEFVATPYGGGNDYATISVLVNGSTSNTDRFAVAANRSLVFATDVAAGAFACGVAGQVETNVTGGGTKVGGQFNSRGSGGTNIGVYGNAANGTTNWAGYFDGNVAGGAYTTLSDATLKENVEDIDAAKALQFRNGLSWKRYELFSEQQVEIMEEVTEEVQKTDAEGNPVVDEEGNAVMETVTRQEGTGRYEVVRTSQGRKFGLIAQEVRALAEEIGAFSEVVAEVGEYFELDSEGYPVEDADGNPIKLKRLGLDYDAVQFIICAGEQSLLPAVV